MTKKIIKLMRKNKITGRQIAKELEVSEFWISKVIHRKGTSARVMNYIARAVGVPVAEILPSYARGRASEGKPSQRKAA